MSQGTGAMNHGEMVTIVSAIILSVGGVLAAMIQRVHQVVNSRMTEMLELTRKAGKAEGVKEQKEKE